jgi:hypothetical protein
MELLDMQTRSIPAITFLLPMLVPGCTQVTTFANVDHCALNEGDRYCADRFPDKPYCIQGQGECSIGDRYGCVAEVAPECHAPCGVLGEDECGTGSSSGTGSGTGTGTETGSETASESGESSTTGPMPCVGDEECTDPEAPFCGVNEACGTCEATKDPDGACAGLDPGLPLCVGGACVACTPENPVVCDEQLLLCDGDTNACVPCTEHDQCGSGACELAVGMCFPPDMVVHVDGDPGAMPADFPSVAAAIASVGPAERRVIVVHELEGDVPYLGGVTIGAGTVIALFGAPGENPVIQGTAGNPGVTVDGAGSALYMTGVRVALSSGVGLRVNSALAWVDRSAIVQNTGGGVLAEAGAELVLRNCFVGRNGDDFADTRGITATNATLDVLYTTVAANDGTGATGPISMSCDATSTGEVRNSIVAAGTNTIACPNVSFSFGVVDTNGLSGSDNEVLSFDPGWFPNIASADFHVAAGPPFTDVAQWQAGDPSTDIDGDPRPNIDGILDYAGADVP